MFLHTTTRLSGSWVCVKLLQSCLTLCNPLDCSPPGSSLHGIFLGKNTEVDCHSSSRGSSQPKDQSFVSCFLHWQADSLQLSHLGSQRKPLLLTVIEYLLSSFMLISFCFPEQSTQMGNESLKSLSQFSHMWYWSDDRACPMEF